LSFPVVQEFEMLMQESIKEVINIHKCKFFFLLILCGLAGRARRPDPNCHPYEITSKMKKKRKKIISNKLVDITKRKIKAIRVKLINKKY